jgi:hypothetical protein
MGVERRRRNGKSTHDQQSQKFSHGVSSLSGFDRSSIHPFCGNVCRDVAAFRWPSPSCRQIAIDQISGR